tara:strand:+ start:50 stop:499 length:450 start_codon:yes stop_codon:yes gene_type:complete
MKSINWLNLKRKVRFGDCDSANVIHFHNLLKWSHEAWEESMDKYGIPINEIFPDGVSKEKSVLPIINCEAKFLGPIHCGDLLSIQILPQKINNHLFQVKTLFFKDSIKVAESIISHISINPITRIKTNLSENLEKWIEASNLNNLVKEC